ncbi:class I SAM-dependent DNA methyltransferase [Bdellovibrio sp. NC01]|uniref:HsdM family class I SAM-dependent methyltransferase n=1 Tax=Bdellovibrio sp. NC01 TaxID=2220073 RepID=UPI00115B3285|nr:N-6 DNA methylase [Bdellovibrio sp. NC01]QDK36717.1 hypothetical protein DOE51_03415 [Bdellovibrio sp. NC01]
MNNQQLQKFLDSFNKSSISKKGLSFDEDHYTAEIFPYFKESLNVYPVFNTGDHFNKRPDITIFLNENDATKFEGAVAFFESKLPQDFAGLSAEKVLEKYFVDKIFPYVSSWNTTLSCFGIHCFNRFILLKVTREIKTTIQSTNISSKSEIKKTVKILMGHCVDVDLSSSSEAKSNFKNLTSWLHKNCSLDSLLRETSDSYIGCVKIKDRKDIQRAASSIVDILLSDMGILSTVQSRFDEALLDDKSSVANSFRLFLSIRFPELSDEQLQDKLGSKNEKDLFNVATVYNLVSKLFLIRYVDEVYSSDSFPLYEADLRFFDESVKSKKPEIVSQIFVSGIKKLRKNSHSLYSKILTKDSLFDWILDSEVLGTSSFKDLFMTFQSLGFVSEAGKVFTEEDFLGCFFEAFAQRFDAESRREYGQYYTPKTVVNFIWDKVLDVLEKENISRNDVKLLDPACGSGTFLTTGVGKLLDNAGLSLQEKLVAFDISPLAVRLTEINLFLEFLKKLKSEDRPLLKNLEVYNTDALEISESEYWRKRLLIEENPDRRGQLTQETELNKKHKKNKEYTLIVTNPPYNGSSSRSLESLQGRFTLLDHLIETRHSTDRLRDDYVWFFGAIDRYINDNGVVGLITSDTYLNKSSYRNLRAYLYKNYRIHSIHHLGKNIFDDVKVSTSIIVMSKLQDQKVLDNAQYEIDYYNFRSLNENKTDRTLDERYQAMTGKLKVEPEKIIPTLENHFSFSSSVVLSNVIPFFANKANLRLVNEKSPGIVTGLNDFFISKDSTVLKTRIQSLTRLVATVKGCVDQKYFKIVDGTNDEVRDLGFDIFEGGKFSKFQIALKSEALELGLIKPKESEKSKKQTLLYLSMLVACCIVKKVSLSSDKIRQIISVDSKIDAGNRWGLRANQLDYIFFENKLVIPRITKNGSTISGGPITCWREGHDPKVKIIFTTPSGDSGIPRMLLFNGSEKPLMLKTVAEGEAEGHFCGIDDVVLPQSFQAVFQQNKLNALYYVLGVYNSKWCANNIEYIMNAGVPIPVPNDLNKERVIEISRIAKVICENQSQIEKAKSSVDWDRIKNIFKKNDLNFSESSDDDSSLIIGAAEKKIDELVSSLFVENIVQQKPAESENTDAAIIPMDFKDVVRRRLAISSYIVENLRDDNRLGLVKFQKIFYLLDSVLGIDLKTSYKKDAAGPHDSSFIYGKKSGIKVLGDSHGIFSIRPEVVGDKELARLVVGENAGRYAKSFHKWLSERPEQMAFANRILREFKNISGTKAEVITTLYSLLAQANEMGIKLSDDQLIEAFYNWHEKKRTKFQDRSFVSRTLKWMKENALVPPKFAKSKLIA